MYAKYLLCCCSLFLLWIRKDQDIKAPQLSQSSAYSQTKTKSKAKADVEQNSMLLTARHPAPLLCAPIPPAPSSHSISPFQWWIMLNFKSISLCQELPVLTQLFGLCHVGNVNEAFEQAVIAEGIHGPRKQKCCSWRDGVRTQGTPSPYSHLCPYEWGCWSCVITAPTWCFPQGLCWRHSEQCSPQGNVTSCPTLDPFGAGWGCAPAAAACQPCTGNLLMYPNFIKTPLHLLFGPGPPLCLPESTFEDSAICWELRYSCSPNRHCHISLTK